MSVGKVGRRPELRKRLAEMAELRSYIPKRKPTPKVKATVKKVRQPVTPKPEPWFPARPVTIYGLMDWRTCEIRYVGSSINVVSRKKGHLKTRARLVSAWIEEAGEENILALTLARCDELTRQETEQGFIDGYRSQGADLLNTTKAFAVAGQGEKCDVPDCKWHKTAG